MIRALKGHNKVTERVEDISAENLLWPGSDITDEWAWLNEDKKVAWILFDFFSSSAAGCIRVRLKKEKKEQRMEQDRPNIF